MLDDSASVEVDKYIQANNLENNYILSKII